MKREEREEKKKLTTRSPTLYAQNNLNASRGSRKSRRYSPHLCEWTCESSLDCAGYESD